MFTIETETPIEKWTTSRLAKEWFDQLILSQDPLIETDARFRPEYKSIGGMQGFAC